MTLSATRFAKPAGPRCSASYTVAIPPCATFRTSRNAPAYSRMWSSVCILAVLIFSAFAEPFVLTSFALHDAGHTGYHDHRRGPDWSVRRLLRGHAWRDRAHRGRASGARRAADGTLPGEIHFRCCGAAEDSRQGSGDRSRDADAPVSPGRAVGTAHRGSGRGRRGADSGHRDRPLSLTCGDRGSGHRRILATTVAASERRGVVWERHSRPGDGPEGVQRAAGVDRRRRRLRLRLDAPTHGPCEIGDAHPSE